MTAPDTLFQPLNPQLGPAPAQPPAQIAIMPFATFGRTYAPALRTLTPAAIGSSAVPGAQDGVQWQVQAQVEPTGLGSSPSQALKRTGQVRRRVERTLTGRVQFVDNLSDSLTNAAPDALYAQTLYIMLAVPGALVALGLSYLAALGTAARDRRDLALLRARGATRRKALALAMLESIGLGVVAGLTGAALAIVATSALVDGGVGLTPGRAAIAVGACITLAFAGALAARLAATAGTFAGTAGDARHRSDRRAPLWQRLYLDVALLAVSGLIFWLTIRTGFSAVVNPDSNSTLSLSVYMFFAPALLWLGATLLLVRLRGRTVAWLAGRGAGRRPTSQRGFLLASAGRRGTAINRGLVLVGLLLAFGVDLGIFTATYDQQARVDAQLALGADVVATAPTGVIARKGLDRKIAAVPGVSSVSIVDHSYAYVGPDLQDTYGVDPATLARTTKLRDSYFIGGTAAQMLDRLRSTPDGILVSKETITDYSLNAGDLLRLRVLDRRSGRFRVVPFHVVGIAQEFPSAPKDSFMVTNLRYLQAATHDGGANVVLVHTNRDPVAVAQRVAATTSFDGSTVRNIRQQTQQTVTSITTVDLTGIARIESVFAVLLAAAAMSLFIGLGFAERRQEFATMAALGVSLRQISAFLWSEAALSSAPVWSSLQGSAGYLPGCTSRCCSTSSTRPRTRSRCPGGSSSCSARQRSEPRRRQARSRLAASADSQSARPCGSNDRRPPPLIDEIITMINQQLDLAVHPLTWLRPRQIRLAQRRPRDRERVDRVRLPPHPAGSPLRHRQLRRDPHQLLGAAKQLPLKPGRQQPAVLECPQALRVERRSPADQLVAADRHRPFVEHPAGLVDRHSGHRLLVYVHSDHDHLARLQ